MFYINYGILNEYHGYFSAKSGISLRSETFKLGEAMVQRQAINQMEQLEDLLPGIEQFLSGVLSQESLSQHAEEQRLYFLERLDIIKLPPSIPPRPRSLGIRLYPLHSSPPPTHNSVPSSDQDDFAAYQRELSRALVDSETSPEPTEVKLYDDIDLSDISFVHEHSTIQTEEESVYEIPQAKTRNLSDSGYEKAKNRTLSDSGYEKAIDVSPVPRSASVEAVDALHSPCIPPPLPPRRERATSDAASRSSIGSLLEDKMLELNQKLVQESHTSAEKGQDNKSERSSDDILDEGTDDLDGLSCDSMEESGSLTRLSGVQLPKSTKKRRRSQRRKITQSLTSMKEIAVPLKNLDDIVLTGELHYRSKLTWTKKIVALTNGRLICYKPDKAENRPSFVILLTGYDATFQKREGKRNFEINLTHENFESHMFLADFKEWAEIWCEYIKYSAQGKKPPGPVLNLARGSSGLFDGQDGTYQLGKSPVGSSGSNVSLASSDGFDTDPGTVKVKKRDSTGTKTARMGSFAFKATQFFESLGKRSSVRKTSSTGSDKPRPLSAALSQSSLTEEITSPLTPLTPESGMMSECPLEVKKHIKHQGYLGIYSSFNKRKWGKRWCMVHENSFECYRTQTSEVCELEFLLHDCVLRRAIEETKSELGLMLMENNREKITIEPMNWTELGSWLRVLMKETGTPEVPKGLAGYMDDTNPYHEAVEVTRLSLLSDPFPKSPTSSPGLTMLPSNQTSHTNDVNEEKSNSRNRNLRNRDSGNCSSESMDAKFGSLERSEGRQSQSGYTDLSLPRVTLADSGDIYTQIRKHSSNGSLSKCSSLDQDTYRSKSEGRETSSGQKKGNQILDFNFDTGEMTLTESKESEGSLVDEIMSQFRSRLSSSLDVDVTTDSVSEEEDISATLFSNNKELSDVPENVVDIKDTASSCTDKSHETHNNSTLNRISVGLDKNSNKVNSSESGIHEQDSDNISDDIDVQVTERLCAESTLRKTSSLLYGERGLTEVIEELRTRLVQLKKDRISIRDRKEKVTSHIDKEYLEAEFNRLNRECDKVAEEIKYLEKVQKLEKIVANKEMKGGNSAGAGKVANVPSDENFKSHSVESSDSGENKNDDVESNSGTDDMCIDKDLKENLCRNNVSEAGADLKACDNILVPTVTNSEAVIETVTESIVANVDLVHKPEVVDANVIIVEPQPKVAEYHADQRRKSNDEQVVENTRKNGDVEEGMADLHESATKLVEEKEGETESDIVSEEQNTVKIDEEAAANSEESSESDKSDNGVMKDLVDEFQQKLKLDSESDC